MNHARLKYVGTLISEPALRFDRILLGLIQRGRACPGLDARSPADIPGKVGDADFQDCPAGRG